MATTTSSIKLLFIDNDPEEHAIMDFYVEQIRGLPCELQAVLNSRVADELLARERFDVVIADQMLDGDDPYRQGSAYLEALMASHAATAMLLISGIEPCQLDEGTRQHIKAGRLYFLAKQDLSADRLRVLLQDMLFR